MLNKRQFVPYHMQVRGEPPETMSDEEYDRADAEMGKTGHGTYGDFCIDHGHQFANKLRQVGLEPQIHWHSGDPGSGGCQECMYGKGPTAVIK